MYHGSNYDMENYKNFQSLSLFSHVIRNPLALDYYKKMSQDNRLIVVYDSFGNDLAFIAFSMTDDYKPYATKKTWSYLPHDPNGKTCFIEKLAAKVWNSAIRNQIRDIIILRYPNVEQAIWYRPKYKNGMHFNLKITVTRRENVRDKVSIE